jgi:hypothetical protein
MIFFTVMQLASPRSVSPTHLYKLPFLASIILLFIQSTFGFKKSTTKVGRAEVFCPEICLQLKILITSGCTNKGVRVLLSIVGVLKSNPTTFKISMTND